MNNSILVRAGRLAVLGHAALIPASASAQFADTRLGTRAEAAIQIRVSVAPRFMTSNRASTENGVAINVASNAPGLRYKVIAQQPDIAEGDGVPQMPAEKGPPAKSRTLLLIVPD